VVLRIYAPNALEVIVRGEWMPAGRNSEPLAGDAQGVWSATSGPLTADLYSYSFTIDGVRVIDPKNGEAKSGTSLSVGKGERSLPLFFVVYFKKAGPALGRQEP